VSLDHFVKDLSAARNTARRLDAEDPLAGVRDRFFYPANKIYLDGNSLGLLSRDGERHLLRILGEWKDEMIQAWLGGAKPWFYFAERLGAALSPMVGAEPDEVVATGTTTVNLHTLVATFYRPSGRRTRILADSLTFPSDVYALSSQIRLHGLDPADHLVFAPTCDGRTLDEETIIDHMTEEVALVLLPSVLYRSGQLLDIERLTRAAHERDIIIGFDCSHSVGAVPHRFDAWDVDFAFWCSYKYLCGGPGCPAFLYLNRRHFDRGPGLAGWFGYVKEKQFQLRVEFEHAQNAGGWQISSPSILAAAPIEGALEVIHEVGIERIREKSLRMTAYLIYLIDHVLASEPYGFEVGTPREPAKRGGHVALEHPRHAASVYDALFKRGVIGDLRPPNVIRLSPSALYNTYDEIWRTVEHVKDIVNRGEHERPPEQFNA
jgi:kynureninase